MFPARSARRAPGNKFDSIEQHIEVASRSLDDADALAGDAERLVEIALGSTWDGADVDISQINEGL